MLFWGFWPLSACLHAAGGTSRHNGAEIAGSAPVRPTPAYLSNKMARRCRISAGRRGSDVYKIYRCGVWSRYHATVEKNILLLQMFEEKLTCLSWMTEWGVFYETLCVQAEQQVHCPLQCDYNHWLCSGWWRRLSLFRRNWVTQLFIPLWLLFLGAKFFM